MLRLSWMISLGITLVGFLVIEFFFSTTPDSSHENFGFIGITFLLPFLLLSLFITFRYFLMMIRNMNNRLHIINSIIIGLLIIVASLYFAIDYKQTIDAAGDVTFSLFTLTKETSRIFFNMYTFVFLHSMVGWIGIIFGLFSNKKAETPLD